jgi:hypothetical protein
VELGASRAKLDKRAAGSYTGCGSDLQLARRRHGFIHR